MDATLKTLCVSSAHGAVLSWLPVPLQSHKKSFCGMEEPMKQEGEIQFEELHQKMDAAPQMGKSQN